jgi:hypothetical protein
MDKIKYYLRKNQFYKNYLQTVVNNFRYYVRDCNKYCKKYSLKKDKIIQGNTLFFIIDPKKNHPGLADRLKVIVGCYYIAKQNGFDFKLIFEHPFPLRNYLSPNLYNWYATEHDLSYSIQNRAVVSYNGMDINKLRKRKKQYHVYNYTGYNVLQKKNIPKWEQLWGELFRELFSPTEYLKRQIESVSIDEDTYIAVHLRFVNALDVFEKGHFNSISTTEEKENLIERCANGIKQIISDYEDKKIIVFSDSIVFLEEIKKINLPILILDGKKIGHISFESSDEIVLKTFIDFYMISKAYKVIAIRSPEMYNSVFSYYAALAGNKKYEIHQV